MQIDKGLESYSDTRNSIIQGVTQIQSSMSDRERASGKTVEELATERDRITADRRAKGLLLAAKSRHNSGVDG